MNEHKRIMIVDDDPINLELLAGVLEDGYQILSLDSGRDCLKALNNFKPQLILLDIEMPGLDGLETCKQIMAHNNEIQVIFISSRASVEERLEGYNVGGVDYIVKPINGHELLNKVKLIIQQIDKKEALDQLLEGTTEAFMDVVSGSGELGLILHYASSLFSLEDHLSVGKALVHTCTQLGIKSVVYIKAPESEYFIADNQQCTPMEKDILLLLKDKGRVYDFGKRTQINDDNVSLLVKNIPSKPEEYSRLKEHMPLLLELTKAQIKSLELHDKVNKSQQFSQQIETINHQLNLLDSELRANNCNIINAMDDTLSEMEGSLQYLALSEQQEEKLLTLIKAQDSKIKESVDKIGDSSDELGSIVSKLKKLL